MTATDRRQCMVTGCTAAVRPAPHGGNVPLACRDHTAAMYAPRPPVPAAKRGGEYVLTEAGERLLDELEAREAAG